MCLFACIEADFQREYGIDLLTSDMSWRRFRTLYAGLSPRSACFRNYDRIARKYGARDETTGRGAWEALTALARPRGANDESFEGRSAIWQ